jgi:hypothetical protein
MSLPHETTVTYRQCGVEQLEARLRAAQQQREALLPAIRAIGVSVSARPEPRPPVLQGRSG